MPLPPIHTKMSVVSSFVVGAMENAKKKKKIAIFFFLTSQKLLIEQKYLTQTPTLKEVGVLKEHLKFALFKLQSNNERKYLQQLLKKI